MSMLEKITDNFKTLIALYEREKVGRRQAEADLEASRCELASCREHIAVLERQIENLKLSGAFKIQAGDETSARTKIVGLIKEIDRCISLLEN